MCMTVPCKFMKVLKHIDSEYSSSAIAAYDKINPYHVFDDAWSPEAISLLCEPVSTRALS